MLTALVPDSVIGTNAYVLATGRGQEAVVVDPGFDVADRIEEVLLREDLRPAAVLLTHGHADHVWSVVPVARPRGCASAAGSAVPAVIHADDAHRLTDPLDGLSPSLLAMLEQHFGASATWEEPDRVETFAGSATTLELAGLTLRAVHAPGHTEGSAVFVLDGVPDGLGAAGEGLTSTVLSGDVLFAGSIGRTDLPGGDGAAMSRSLRDVVLPMPDDRLVLPGHGGATTIGRERASNPHLLALH